MATFGIKTSPTGQDVTKIDTKNQQFTSEAASPKIFKTSLNGAPLTSPSVGTTSSITVDIFHGLTYSPSFMFWYKDESGSWHFANSMNFNLNGGPGKVVIGYLKSDKANLTFQLVNNDASNTHRADYHYAIFADQLL